MTPKQELDGFSWLRRWLDEQPPSFEECIINAIDALDPLQEYIQDFLEEIEQDQQQRQNLQAHLQQIRSVLADLRKWGLGIKAH